jgi:hypothetical protein
MTLSIMTFSTMTLHIITLSITTFSLTSSRLMTFSITTISIMTLSTTTNQRDTQHNGKVLLCWLSCIPSVMYAEYRKQAFQAECHYTKCRCAECRGAATIAETGNCETEADGTSRRVATLPLGKRKW